MLRISNCSYDIMLQCWSASPESRPLFHVLTKNLGQLLEGSVAEHYIDLNEPYLQMNANSTTEGQTDYLALMAVPDAPAPPVPIYVNGTIQPKAANGDGTTEVTKIDIDASMPSIELPSARPSLGNNLNVNQIPFKYRRKNPDIPEEIPMLNRSTKSDSETDFNNLEHSILSNPIDDTTDKSSYVNVPSTISSTKNSISNPTYIVVENINETRY